ncbi:BTAD domain-containing putative transcriptional regulator [Micromonospora sp. KC213]|uniref:BTAD domain-containing putative transcriptional regulator n=1 Tax=Micromonospora sp. KC213 TaxID=2530378 RepID=UPI001052A10C|nr:BTAD domain-containing putative transcriptional regulator [Micromonospora sp. KC213]TDC43482.1 hypothetical protein E1166_03430 [Micromonospora sp. KC213]
MRHSVLIEAGGGFGKSVLIRQVGASTGNSIEVSLPRDHPVTIDELTSSIFDAAEQTTDWACPPANGTARRIGALLAASPEPSLLVVDNAEALTDDAAAWLADLAQDGPQPPRILVSGRLLPAPLAAMEFQGTAARFNTQDLRLTQDEAGALARLEIGDEDGARLAATLHDLSGGWVALLLVMLRRLARTPDRIAAATVLLRHPGLIRQLMDHYAADLDPSDRYLLTQVAAFPMVNDRLVEGLGHPGLLRRLIRAGIPFAVGANGWSRLCSESRESLAALAPLDPAIAQRAAPLLMSQGAELAAASLLADSGDPEQAATLVAKLPTSRINQLDPVEFIHLMARLGPAAEAAPQVLLHLARTHRNLGQLAEEREVIGRALRIVREQDADDDLATEVESEWLIQRALVREPDVLAHVERLLDGAAEGTRAQASLLEALGVALSDRPDEPSLRRAENAMRQAAIMWGELGEPARVAAVQRALATHVLSVLGKTGEGAMLLRRLGTTSDTQFDRMLCLVMEARLLALSGEADRPLAILDDGIRLAELLGIDWVTGHAAWTRLIVAANDHDTAGVLEHLARAEAHLGQLMNHDGGGLLFLCEAADACAVVGADGPAARLLATAREHRIEDSLTVALTEAFIDARRGDPAAADVLQRMLKDGEIAPCLRWKAELLTGYVRHAAGDIDAADQCLLLALDRAASLGHPDLLDRRERRVAGVLRSAIRLPSAAVDGPPAGEGAGEGGCYEVRVLGGFEVRKGNTVLHGTGRVSQLVKHLVLANGSVRVETMVEALWPGEMPGVGQRRLKNVLTRVRAAYGSLVSRTGQLLSLSSCKVDLHAFEDLARAVAAAQDDERVARARIALTAFGGPLLPDDLYDDAITQRREVMRRRVLGLIDVVLTAAIDADAMDEAMARLEAAMDLDPYDQERPLRVTRALIARQRYLEAGDLAVRVIAAAGELGLPLAVEWNELSLGSLSESRVRQGGGGRRDPHTMTRAGLPATDACRPAARRNQR